MRTGEALGIVVVLCPVAYIWWRLWVWQSRLSWCRTLIPPSNQLSWKISPSDQKSADRHSYETSSSGRSGDASGGKNKSGKLKRRLASARPKIPAKAAAAAFDTAAAASRSAAALAKFDPEALRTIQASISDELRSINSINDYVEASFHDVSATSAQAWIQRLEDYVAEQQAAIALEKAGRMLQLRADKAGWRWLADGHPIVVREGVASVAGAKKTIVDLRTAAEKKRGMTRGSRDFDHDAIATASKDALSVIHEGFDLGLHIPLGTLLRSTWRELELLFDKKTPIERAVKHVAMDVASVGTGAYLGAKIGGGIGVFAGPLGVGAGVMVGAMAGAIAGRGLAHKSRMAPFSSAFERYQMSLSNARTSVDSALAESKDELKDMQSHYQEKFEAARSEIELAARQKIDEIEKTQIRNLDHFLRRLPDHLGALEAQLLQDEAAVLKQMSATHWWNWIFPRRQEFEKSVTRKWFKHAKKIAMKERRRFMGLKGIPTAALLSKVHRFLNIYTFSLRSFDEALDTLIKEFAESVKSAETLKQAALREAENVRNQMLADFRDQISKMYFALCQTIAGWKDKVQASLDELRRQADPLGIELPE